MFSISTRGRYFCLPAVEAVWLCESEDTVRSFNHGKVLSMAYMHFMKFTLENRIGQKKDIRQKMCELGGYGITVMVFVVNKKSPTNPTGPCQAAEWLSTSPYGPAAWFASYRLEVCCWGS